MKHAPESRQNGLQDAADYAAMYEAILAPTKRKKPRVSMTVLSRKHLEADGWYVETVEQNVRAGGKTWKKDLFGFGDLLAIRRGEVLLVQTTSSTNMAARITKITESPLLAKVREAGIGIVVHGWANRVVKRGEPKREWTLRVEDLS